MSEIVDPNQLPRRHDDLRHSKYFNKLYERLFQDIGFLPKRLIADIIGDVILEYIEREGWERYWWLNEEVLELYDEFYYWAGVEDKLRKIDHNERKEHLKMMEEKYGKEFILKLKGEKE